MIDSSPTWLTDACARLIADSADHRPSPAAATLADAARLGERAAAQSLTIADAVNALMAASEAHWATTPVPRDRQGGRGLLAALRALIGATIDGYHRSARDEAGRREPDRAAFIDDLFAAHSDPGRLAARAQRYGIRLSGQHTVIAARTPGLAPDAAHAIDDALAARFGAAKP